MEEDTNKTNKKRYDWLKPYQFEKGGKGGPGRPKGKTLKEFAREYLQSLPDDRKIEYLATLPEDIIWKMAEGNPDTKQDVTVREKPIPLDPDALSKDNSLQENKEPIQED